MENFYVGFSKSYCSKLAFFKKYFQNLWKGYSSGGGTTRGQFGRSIPEVRNIKLVLVLDCNTQNKLLCCIVFKHIYTLKCVFLKLSKSLKTNKYHFWL